MKVVWVNPDDELAARPDGMFSDVASVRYRALIPAKELTARGHHASVIGLDRGCFNNVRDQIADADFVVFRRNHSNPECSEQMLREMTAQGVKTLFDISDDSFSDEFGPHFLRMSAQAGTIVTASANLQEIVRRHAKRESIVVGDPFEGRRGEARWLPGRDRLKALWFGNGANIPSLQAAFPALLNAGNSHPIDLRIVTHYPGLERACKEFNGRYRHRLSLRYAEWSIKETASSLAATDFVLIPAMPDARWTLAKSPNRIIESLWAGRFVVAYPIPSYLEFKDWAWLGADPAEGIAWTIANGGAIPDRIRAAQDHIDASYSPQRIGLEWERVLSG